MIYYKAFVTCNLLLFLLGALLILLCFFII